MAEIGWVAECPDDVWADCLHYYQRDIYRMDGAQALKLAYRLPHIVRFEVQADPPYAFSSVFRFFDELKQQADETEVASLADLREIDPAGDVEFVEVVGG